MQGEEKIILSNLKKGDEETFVYLFREYFVPLCAHSRKFVKEKETAEEIVSETLFHIWEKRESLQIRSSLIAYLFQSVTNNSIHYLKKKEKEKNLDDYLLNTQLSQIEPATSLDKTMENLIAKDFSDQINRAIENLPQQQKKVFKLKRFEDRKNREIAEELDISVKTVEMHLYKAMISLQKALKQYFPILIPILILVI